MRRAFRSLSSGLVALAVPMCTATLAIDPAFAQEASGETSFADQATAGEGAAAYGQGDIIVTATRRASPLSDVPLAVTAVTADALRDSGATDIRQLNQLSPSLLVSSSSSEAGAGGARIRGIGTVGDNAGLESSVATFIDGVYRNRAGVGLTELGPIDRIEVLRGPQGTLFGRNASAGLINVVTARPRFEDEGYAEGSYGNYNYYRLAGGVTGPINEHLAYRFDGVYTKRDGFLKDVISGRRVNGRDRYLLRGKLLYEPGDDLSVLLIADYARRNEECCAATYLPAQDVTATPGGGIAIGPSSTAALIRGMTSLVPGAGQGLVLDDTYARKIAITPGRDYRSDVRDRGISGEVNWKPGGATLTSITAYREWKYIKGQDADFTNLDILYRPGDGSGYTRFKTFSQELRLQGSAFGDRVDWLIGGYYAHENLALNDNLQYGADFEQFAAARVGAASPALAAFPRFGFQNLNGFTQAFVNAQLAGIPTIPAAARPLVANAIASQVQNTPLNGIGILDRFRQTDNNFAIFTHDIVKITDTVSLTLGARYTDDRKRLNADLNSNSTCGAYVANIQRLRALAAASAANPGGNGGLNPAIAGLSSALAEQVLAPLAGLPCVTNSVNGDFSDGKHEGEWSGTAVFSFKPSPKLLAYASYSRGYKAGGFNLDRAPLFDPRPNSLQTATSLDVLKFQPEKVDSFEIGAKFSTRGFSLNVAAFHEVFRSFQLNTFNGTNFFVTDIRGCKDDLDATDRDLIPGNSSCAHTGSGVVSNGVELEAFMYPARGFAMSAGFTYADARYRGSLAGTPDYYLPQYGNSLSPALFLLPGSELSNASRYVVTGSARWSPPIGANFRGLLYADFRYTSELNTGSDLFPEKIQQGVMIVNARAGIGPSDGDWSLEFWVQNLLDTNYSQVIFNSPLQGSNTSYAQTALFGTPSTQLFSSFLAEPRTFGVTVRTKF